MKYKLAKRGFTLIELLIVIALLGALAVGLLAALDPFEQLKKGTDTGVRNTVSEIHGAAIRYYAIKNYMPWCEDATCSTTVAQPDETSLTTLNGAAFQTAVTSIVDAGELKSGFVSLAGGQMDKIFVTGTNDPPAISVCYKPTAKAFRADPNTKFDKDGVESADGSGITCPDEADAAAECYWCIQ